LLKKTMDNINQQKILDVSWATILRIISAFAMLYFLYLVKDLLVWFLFALVISVLFNPAINFLQKLRIPRVLAAIFVYVGIFVCLGLFIYKMTPFLFIELREFTTKLPEYFEKASPYLSPLRLKALESFQAFSSTVEQALYGASTNIFTAVGSIFGGLFAAVTIFAIAFFLSLEEKGLERTLYLIAPREYKDRALKVWARTQKKVSLWFGTRILGMLFVGISTAITCYVLNIKYAAFFGLLAGISDIIVTIGPLISGGVIAIVIALSSVSKAFAFILAFTFIQQIEGHILLPVLAKRFLRLPPSLVLISILIGSRLWGILGAILAIPLMGMIFEFVKGILEKRGEVVSHKEDIVSQE
ncbi:AI-2E family transporter, partial [bacterium]|nr:AI-2E family transporter [bacterium]